MPLSTSDGSGKALLPIQTPGKPSNVNPNSQPVKRKGQAKKPKRRNK